ncbi:hypothetical protein, conserved [Eimeria maxima]|uniref:Transmembrane protein n=1 Tax=Eimeria maxima TaxID=5804 RepID=U6M3X5_EIMMA|nr:hypothetical protein, conserved [Eimeria maxima]CDJ56400.1 hypothetical protein, conserved [Eimeria maxima]
MRFTCALASQLLLFLTVPESSLGEVAAAEQDVATASVGQLSVGEPTGADLPLALEIPHAVDKESHSHALWSVEGLHAADSKVNVRGLKSSLAGLLFVAAYLLAHILSNRQSMLLRRGPSAGLASGPRQTGKRRRGLHQMVIGASLFFLCLGAGLTMGPLVQLPLVENQLLSAAAAGLFLWGAALYFDPYGMVM